MKEDLGKFVYYSNSDENLYVMIDGTLYLVNLKDNTREVLVKDLEEGQYQVSPDGHLLAYHSEGVEAMQEPIYPDRVCTRCIKWISSRRNRR